MATTDLGACEWFVWDLRRSNLIDRGRLDQIVGEFLRRNPGAEPPALADYLVSQQILTPFQAERILQGKTQGLVLGPYTLTDAIGTGSMGTVYKAISKTDKRWYAVKVLPRRSMWNVRLARRQVRAFEQFQHPAVVPFLDVGTAGGLHYLVWPFVEEGETLEAIVQREGKLAPELTANYGLQIAAGLNVCHQHGVFHGLLKPSNVMVSSDHQVHILDFGIGSLLAENEGESLVDTMSTANTLTSGLDCASPESIMEPTNRTPAGDQYSLGCVLYYCLAGRYPFPNMSAVEKMMAHQMKQPTPLRELNPDVPPELAAVVERLMEKNPEARFAGADEVMEALRPFAPSTPLAKKKPVRGPEAMVAPARNVDNGQRGAAPAPATMSGTSPLPSRESLRGGGTGPGSPGKRVIPGGVEADEGSFLGGRFGPIVFVLLVVAVGVLAWVLFQKYYPGG
ncbi:MAG: serine/threonine protein kinase [Gemmataceae bacterium]|nr:serine/threonine protein kinase [Gemmataceae bacterium]MDW8264682.1 serine/threonine-protein kinase [Gemmataceae bacterium]